MFFADHAAAHSCTFFSTSLLLSVATGLCAPAVSEATEDADAGEASGVSVTGATAFVAGADGMAFVRPLALTCFTAFRVPLENRSLIFASLVCVPVLP